MIFHILEKQEMSSGQAVRVSLQNDPGSYVQVDAQGRKSLIISYKQKKKPCLDSLAKLMRQMIVVANTNHIRSLSLVLDDLISVAPEMTREELVRLFASQTVVANYAFTKYKSSDAKKEMSFVTDITLIASPTEALQEAVQTGRLIGEQTNACRDFANMPPSDMNPESLVHATSKLISDTPIKMTVFEKEEITQHGMGGVLGVSRGSSVDPRFIILEYNGANQDQPIVLVGKGVTFDSGGYGIKPAQGMLEMHMDMSGAAAVINTIVLAAKLKLKKHIIALVPAVENMVSGDSYKPSDVLTMMNGKTVEVIHTDAEGRLILADALCYAKKLNPKVVIDVATLTGACVVALGEKFNGLFTRDDALANMITQAAQRSVDPVWRLPLTDAFVEDLKSPVADIANLNRGMSSYGGASQAAAFLESFTDYPWVHIDMAPRMMAEKGSHLKEGAIGSPVPCLISFIERY